MSLAAKFSDSFHRSFQLYRDLISTIDQSAFSSSLPGLPSNTLGQQLWCVIGARESFSRALAEDKWVGFDCSLTAEQITSRTDLLLAAKQSEEMINCHLARMCHFTDTQNQMILDLLEHECAHHGQLIRYIYALKLTIPRSWRDKYSLS
ncbi:MAG: hypothetical protein P1U89_12425 [Verrucomicrobiales bacterium]|nr:hypothetical protein [Verrucomicrobiales bacterium]